MKKKKLWVYLVDVICIFGILVSAFSAIKTSINIENSTKNIYTKAKTITINAVVNPEDAIYIDNDNNIIINGSSITELNKNKEVIVSIEDGTLIDSKLAYQLEDGVIYKNHRPIKNSEKYQELSINECNDILIQNKHNSEITLISIFGLLIFTLGLISSKNEEDNIYLND